jgi:ribosome-associated translation inhibitor RaiA
MNVKIIDRHQMVSEELRQFAERRLQFAFSRFASRITSISMGLSDQNGPRGGVDKLCQLRVSLKHASEVVISEQDADLATCIARAVDRASRAAARVIERRHSFDRSKPQFIEP